MFIQSSVQNVSVCKYVLCVGVASWNKHGFTNLYEKKQKYSIVVQSEYII